MTSSTCPATRRRRFAVAALALGLAAAGSTAAVAPDPAAAQADPPSAFQALSTPTRLMDTRSGVGSGGTTTPLASGEVRVLPVAGFPGIPTAATAVVLTLTLTDATAPGYLTAWPSDEARPEASSVNAAQAGQTVANLVVVKLGATGSMSIYAQAGGHVLVDVAGWFEPAGAGVATAGRFVAGTPTRLLDTATGVGATAGRLAAGAQVDVTVGGVAGVPLGATAVVGVASLADASAPGHLTAWPTGPALPPGSSNLNVGVVGQSAANLVVVSLGAGGQVSLRSEGGGHVRFDLVGWFTGAGAPSSASGLFVPLTPARVLDSRSGYNAPAAKLGPGGRVTPGLAGLGGVPGSGVGSVVLNVTVTAPPGSGLLRQGSPTATAVPAAFDAEDPARTVARSTFAGLDGGGTTVLATRTGGHVLADVAGWFSS